MKSMRYIVYIVSTAHLFVKQAQYTSSQKVYLGFPYSKVSLSNLTENYFPSCQSPGQNKWILNLKSANQECYISSSNSSIKCLGTSLTHKQKWKNSYVSKYVINILFNPPGLEERTNQPSGGKSTMKLCSMKPEWFRICDNLKRVWIKLNT